MTVQLDPTVDPSLDLRNSRCLFAFLPAYSVRAAWLKTSSSKKYFATAHSQSGFSYSDRRMQRDHNPMIRRKQLDFVCFGLRH
jgi:hypothetical protein